MIDTDRIIKPKALLQALALNSRLVMEPRRLHYQIQFQHHPMQQFGER